MPPLNPSENSKEEVDLPEQTTQKQPEKAVDLASHGLYKIMVLGEGEFGEVALYRYSGNNPTYRSMCDSHGYVALKVLFKPDPHEEAAARAIARHNESGTLDLSAINKTYPLEIDGQFIGILSEYESYVDVKNDQEIIFSSDLYKLISNAFHPSFQHELPGEQIVAALQSNPAIFLSQIASNIVKGQNTLHQMSILHQDSAARNFLIRVERDSSGNIINIRPKISDYGLTSILAEGEEHGAYNNKLKVPIRIINSGTIITGGQTTILTDYFARKTAVMSIVTAMLKPLKSERDALSLNLDAPQALAQFSESRFKEYLDDNKALKQYLAYVKANLEKCPDKRLVQEIKLFLNCYEPWLTFAPSQDDLKKAQEEENALFEQCTNNFMQAYYEQMILNKKNLSPENYLLGLQRLNGIETPNPNKITKGMIEGNIRQLQKTMEKPTPSAPSSMEASTHQPNSMERGRASTHYGHTPMTLQAQRMAEKDNQDTNETNYTGIVTKEIYTGNAIAHESVRPRQQENPSEHYVQSPSPNVVSQQPSPEEQEESHYGAMQAHPTEPNQAIQESHYTNFTRNRHQPSAQSHPSPAEYQQMPPITQGNPAPLGPINPPLRNENTEPTATQLPQGHYAPIGTQRPAQEKGHYAHASKDTPPSTSPNPIQSETSSRWKKVMPSETTRTTTTTTDRNRYDSTPKTKIKTIWAEFTAEVEQQLAKLSPKDNVDELSRKLKMILKDAQNEIKNLLHINKQSDYKAPKTEEDESEGDNESYHP